MSPLYKNLFQRIYTNPIENSHEMINAIDNIEYEILPLRLFPEPFSQVKPVGITSHNFLGMSILCEFTPGTFSPPLSMNHCSQYPSALQYMHFTCLEQDIPIFHTIEL